MFDNYYISFFTIIKPTFGKRAIKFAFYYVSLIEVSFYALIATFFMAFASQMGLGVISTSKVITLSILSFLFVCLKNWIRFNGKRRHILNAKSKRGTLQLWKLIILPIICVILTIVFSQAI